MTAKKILVTGGAGYIGSHMVLKLLEQGFDVVVYDREALLLSTVKGLSFVQADLADSESLKKVFSQHKFSAVMHFAGSIQVGESIINPALYYQNNLANSLNLLDTMLEYGVDKFIFSSTAAIFGEPQYTPLDEQHLQQAINPYGQSKLMLERVLVDYAKAYGLRSICLRYFNAAGADLLGRTGERHEPETHLIPLILQAALGKRASIKVFGNDYPTPDGTCLRDYIHVTDLCAAHALALQRLLSGAKSSCYNLGNGAGFSVQQVVEVARQVTGKNIKVEYVARRDGDAAILVADSSLAKKELGWEPEYSELSQIIEHAWQWEQSK